MLEFSSYTRQQHANCTHPVPQAVWHISEASAVSSSASLILAYLDKGTDWQLSRASLNLASDTGMAISLPEMITVPGEFKESFGGVNVKTRPIIPYCLQYPISCRLYGRSPPTASSFMILVISQQNLGSSFYFVTVTANA